MASAYSPWYRRFLQKHAPILFRKCPMDNFHWRWDDVCHCCAGTNGMGILVRIGFRWLDVKNDKFLTTPFWAAK